MNSQKNVLFDEILNKYENSDRVGLNFNNKEGTEMLHSACKLGNLNVVEFLVEYGGNLFSTEESYKSTTLHRAVLGNNIHLVDYLLRNGLNVNVEDKNNETPLHRLSVFHHSPDFHQESSECKEKIMDNYLEMIEFLVDNGANVNARDKNSVAPLEKSIYLNLLDISELLLELNANTEFRPDVIFFSYQSNIQHRASLKSTKIDTLELLTTFLAMKTDNIYQYVNAISDISKFTWILPYFHECQMEINRMKEKNICEDRNITIYDILSKNLMQVLIFCKNEEIMLNVESIDYGKEFPLYKYLIKKRIERIRLLINYRNIIIQFFDNLSRKKIPILVFDEIFNLLKVGDVRNFGRALSK